MLQPCFKNNCIEAGLDEAGRGCLAGPVFASAVILPPDFRHPLLRDSKMLTHPQRLILRTEIEKHALAYSVQSVDESTIDKVNILRASIMAMHFCLDQLLLKPQHLAVDGNYFLGYKKIPHKTLVKGDNRFLNIAAASILAKTHRDDWMQKLHDEYPKYLWDKNKGYGTRLHIEAIRKHGLTPYHRLSFRVKSLQMDLFKSQSA